MAFATKKDIAHKNREFREKGIMGRISTVQTPIINPIGRKPHPMDLLHCDVRFTYGNKPGIPMAGPRPKKSKNPTLQEQEENETYSAMQEATAITMSKILTYLILEIEQNKREFEKKGRHRPTAKTRGIGE